MIQVRLPSKDQSLLKQILPVLKRADLDSEQVTVGRSGASLRQNQLSLYRSAGYRRTQGGCVSDSTFSSTLFIQHQSTTTVTFRCFTSQVTTVMSLSDAGGLSSTELNQMCHINDRSLELDSDDTYVITNTDSELLPAAAPPGWPGWAWKWWLFIYILICVYEAISLMLSLLTGLWVKVLALNSLV